MKILIGTVAAIAVVTLLAVASISAASRSFATRMEELKERMMASQLDLDDRGRPELPDIVRSYALRAGGSEEGPNVLHARHSATLATARDATPIAIEANQWTGTTVPGIVWTARGTMYGVPVSVFDAFVAGRGELSARLLGSFQVAGGSGADYDKGELMRYLSELPLYPDAILKLRDVIWRQIDARTVSVTARSATNEATVRFIFDDAGDIVRMEADDRPMETNGTTVPTPWHGFYSRYRTFGDYRIPSYGEVGWVLPDGLFVYWRGEVVSYETMD